MVCLNAIVIQADAMPANADPINMFLIFASQKPQFFSLGWNLVRLIPLLLGLR